MPGGDPAAMGMPPMPGGDPAAMGMPPEIAQAMAAAGGGAPPMPGGEMPPAGPEEGQVGAIGAEQTPGEPGAEAPTKIGDMTTDDFKMFLAETMNEVIQGGGAEAPMEEPMPEEAMGEMPMEEPAAPDESAMRIDALEQELADMKAQMGLMPTDAPAMEAPAMPAPEAGAMGGLTEEAMMEDPNAMLAGPEAGMPKVASQADQKYVADLSYALGRLNNLR